ncbi:hypothetical protein GCM10017600_57390 [Streptosporangium carneum]|uniref:Uncharacterized protein n=1 Tax=Streptosporangium carneum TaxID=47481 RepID=A0A9W6I596_9ACTN|nr:hypothetical protein GCM10017600_57390 [Streptosporangium carneum]
MFIFQKAAEAARRLGGGSDGRRRGAGAPGANSPERAFTGAVPRAALKQRMRGGLAGWTFRVRSLPVASSPRSRRFAGAGRPVSGRHDAVRVPPQWAGGGGCEATVRTRRFQMSGGVFGKEGDEKIHRPCSRPGPRAFLCPVER